MELDDLISRKRVINRQWIGARSFRCIGCRWWQNRIRRIPNHYHFWRWSLIVLAVLWLALIVSLAAYGLMFVLLRRTEATKVAALTYLAPPTTGWLIAIF